MSIWKVDVQEFGQSWSDYVLSRGYESKLSQALYLDTAEQFVDLFLAERGATAGPAAAAHSDSSTARLASATAGELQLNDLRRTYSSSSSGPKPPRDLSGSLPVSSSGSQAAGSGRRRRWDVGPDSRGSSGKLGSEGGSGSGRVRRQRWDVGPDSKDSSTTSLTALAGYCGVPGPARFRGLALLVGFTDDEMKEIAGQVGATGYGYIPRDGPDMQNGWVARLGQVWRQCVLLLPIQMLTGECCVHVVTACSICSPCQPAKV